MTSDSGESSASHPPSRSPSGAFEAISAGTEKTHLPPAPEGKYLAVLTLGALGVVFGDIGTSPLYALKETFAGHHPIAVEPASILGVLSLIFWTVMVLVTLKYVAIIMRADNRGEGGSLALLARVTELTRNSRATWFVTMLGIFAAALFYGDAAAGHGDVAALAHPRGRRFRCP